MSKQRMIVSDDQLLVDFELIFKAIKDEKGNWKKVEKEMRDWLQTVQGMSGE
jgi:acyl-CoA thioesterase FadM